MTVTWGGIPKKLNLGGGYLVGFLPEIAVRGESAIHADYDFDLTVAGTDGRLVCTSFTVLSRRGGPVVTSDVLKGLPMMRLTALALEGFAGPMRRTGKGRWDSFDETKLSDLERVAFEYRLAYAVGAPPTKSVASKLGLSQDVAAKRVQAARIEGLLEPTARGKKGA